MKKIGGNWHKLDTWKGRVLGYKSGGIVLVHPGTPSSKEIYIPFYDFQDFKIEGDRLFILDKQNQVFKLDLDALQADETVPSLQKVQGFVFKESKGMAETESLKGLLEEPRAVDRNGNVTAAAYKQKGIDFFHTGSGEKIGHFDFPGYSFVDDIKLSGNKLYIADVFGLRILDISNLNHPVLDDRFTVARGWAKDIAIYNNYILAADVLGIKIYDKDREFALVGKIESNKNRVAKVVTAGHYAFLSCEAVGLKAADLSDIENPRMVSGVVLPKGVWDCAVYNGHVYLAAYTGGLLKVDFSDIKNLKQVAGYSDGGEVIGVFVNERAVFAGCSHDGFKIFDHDLTPVVSVEGMDGRCWTVLESRGYLFTAAGKGGVYIYDLKNLEKPGLVNRVQTAEARDLIIRDQYLYIADGRQGALVYDIADIKNIRHIKTIPSAAFTRGIMVDGKYIYKADGDGGVEVYEKEKKDRLE